MTVLAAVDAAAATTRHREYRRRRRLGWFWSVPTVLVLALWAAVVGGLLDVPLLAGAGTWSWIALASFGLVPVVGAGERWFEAWRGARLFREELARLRVRDTGPGNVAATATAGLRRVDRDHVAVTWNGATVGFWNPPRRGRDAIDKPVTRWSGPTPPGTRRAHLRPGEGGLSAGGVAGLPYLWCERSRVLVDPSGREWPLGRVLRGGGTTFRRALRDGSVVVPAALEPAGVLALLQEALAVRSKRFTANARRVGSL